MNATVLLDYKTAVMAKNFEHHFNIVDLDYYKINKWLFIPSPSIATLTTYLAIDEKTLDNDPILKKLEKVNKKFIKG